MTFWWILGVLLIGLMAWAGLRASTRPDGGSESAEDTLKRRYARGELDDEMFRRMGNELRRP
jgi:uncharacterized membrane protein